MIGGRTEMRNKKLKKGKMLRFIYVTVKSDNCNSGRNAGGQK